MEKDMQEIFTDDPLDRIKDYVDGYEPREMCLFTRDQVAAV